MKVLHLAPHYGGGVGTVLRTLVGKLSAVGIEHRLVSLDTMNAQMRRWCEENHIPVLHQAMHRDGEVAAWFMDADIVHIHWWNHPLLMMWMASCTMPPFRSVLWSHVNGMHAPQAFFGELFEFADITALTTPYSLDSSVLAQRAGPVRVMQSLSQVKLTSPQAKQRHDNAFGIGYIGTVDYIKMHPQFIRFCTDAGIDDARFVVCGGPNEASLRHEVAQLGLDEQFDIRGPVDEVDEVLAELELFGYPLNPEHYGSGEQVLLEAMGAGTVPVVLDTGCERFIIEDGKEGIIATSGEEYSQALRHLRERPDERKRMASNARSKAERLMQSRFWEAWHALYDELLSMPKRPHRLQLAEPLRAYPLVLGAFLQAYHDTPLAAPFMEICAAPAKMTRPAISLSPGILTATRGTPFHYRSFFPEDQAIRRVCEALQPRESGALPMFEIARPTALHLTRNEVR